MRALLIVLALAGCRDGVYVAQWEQLEGDCPPLPSHAIPGLTDTFVELEQPDGCRATRWTRGDGQLDFGLVCERLVTVRASGTAWLGDVDGVLHLHLQVHGPDGKRVCAGEYRAVLEPL